MSKVTSDDISILFLSDTHSQVNELHPLTQQEFDLIIHSGDLTNSGSLEQTFTQLQWMLDNLKYRVFIFSPGNHDLCLDPDHRMFDPRSQMLMKHFMELYDGFIYLNSNWINLKDYGFDQSVKIYSMPYSVKFGSWAFMKIESEIFKECEKIPEDTDILITHSPSFLVRDQNSYGDHCGSTAIAHTLSRLKTRVHCFGHIHESFGTQVYHVNQQSEPREVLAINAALLDFNSMCLLDPIHCIINFDYLRDGETFDELNQIFSAGLFSELPV